MLPLGTSPGWGSGHGHIPLGHGTITKNGRITLFFKFSVPVIYFLNFKYL
jgi:hypothetical protein